jgi:hypothetical protein
MTFMVVDMDSYDSLLGLDFLMVNMLHRLNLGPTIHDVSTNLEKMQISGIQMTLGVTQQHNSTI